MRDSGLKNLSADLSFLICVIVTMKINLPYAPVMLFQTGCKGDFGRTKV